MNDMTRRAGDDGPGGSHRSGRLIRGIRIGWIRNGRTRTGAPRRWSC